VHSSLPFNRPRRFEGGIVDDAVDAADLVDDMGGDATGRSGEFRVIDIYRRDGGKLAENWVSSTSCASGTSKGSTSSPAIGISTE